MAADILLFKSEVVPVGKDQIQHVEIARDIATKFNNQYGDILTIPEFRVQEEVQTVLGIDGQKMSKSYGNIVNIFGEEKKQLKIIKKIVTQNVALQEPKEFENCNVYNMAKLFLNDNELLALQNRYTTGGEGHGHFKLYLAEIMWDYFSDFRKKREYFEKNQDEVREILKTGANKAKDVAMPTIEKIRTATGISY
jgi:tryptophanyl-tRNA synthetase